MSDLSDHATTPPPDGDTAVSDSGSTMQLLTGGSVRRPVDLAVLEEHRLVGGDEDWSDAGTGPFLEPGQVVLWRYGHGTDPMRVVRDDERGLVAWLAEGTEQVGMAPVDGRALRDVPLAERFGVPRGPVLRRWSGSGVVRIAPTGRPWSVWVFREDDGAHAGHYVNLELTHRRRDGVSATRDLVLDLWLDAAGDLWLKDADELDAAVGSGHCSPEVAAEVRAVAEWAREELVEGGAWPLDEEWTSWQPPADWTVPSLPDSDEVRRARATTLPS
ncbi:DUF402 domain-containing protein [Nocardioides cavernae]|uniref:DUF402 domain-containing protein n=1 Tax=Nocardioides cavernae TaxID=1921566 RepID=A0ABR8NH85_9ACTN|nr:DUF402 domain-containing protein [Nocardioides cavernae]MBD3927205.1 DUF402 domain-containing protein [Nocardioides cavernae]MBM7512926.1 hypothetical protein [Nocardioides cavernae]